MASSRVKYTFILPVYIQVAYFRNIEVQFVMLNGLFGHPCLRNSNVISRSDRPSKLPTTFIIVLYSFAAPLSLDFPNPHEVLSSLYYVGLQL